MQLRDAASEWFLSHDKGELGESDSKLQDTINALASGDVQGRRDACYDSATLGGPEIVAALINTLEQHPDIEYNSISDIYQCSRKGAAYALGKLHGDDGFAAIYDGLSTVRG